MKKVLLSIGLGLLSTIGFAQLSGTYTINSGSPTSGTNFQTFGAAFSALTSQGVNGPVTINVIEGTYNEQVYMSFQSISGASATNTITIQSDAGNSNMPVWTSTSYPIYWQWCTFPYLTIDGIELTTSNQYGFIVYMRYMYQASDITFRNCVFEGGGYQIYNYYTYAYHLTLEDCDFNDFYYRGMYSYYGYYPYVDIDVTGCNFNTNTGYSYPYAIYFYRPGGGTTISGNTIELNGASGGYGIYCYQPQGLTTNPIEISNNIVNFVDENDPYSQYGLFSGYGSHMKVHHNTFRTSNTYQYTRAVYMYMSSTFYQGNEFKNNIVVTSSDQSYGFYGANAGGTAIDFEANAWYQGNSAGELWMYDAYNGGNMYTLTAWQNATGGATSVSADPLFFSNTNLTPQQPDINNIGDSLGYAEDIYGMARSMSTPDPGAIEFSVPTNNAMISDLVTPDAPLCADDTSVSAYLYNSGLVPLTSCSITYVLNGTTNTTLALTGMNLAPASDTLITVLASTSFASGDSIAVYSSMPNGVQDSSAAFDTASVVIFSGLSGTYEIPNDYPTLTDAAADVMQKGVCGHVVMEIATGTYNESIALGDILGSGPDATLTWTSATGDPSDVEIATATSGAVVTLDGSDYVTFEDVSIMNTSTFGRGVLMQNSAENATFDNCVISVEFSPTTSSGACPFWSQGNNHGLTLTGNEILNGGYGLIIYGGSTTTRIEDVTIEDNLIKNAYYYQTRMEYIDGLEFNNNVVTNDTTIYLFNYGVRMYYVDDFNVVGNYIGTESSWNNYPQYGGYAYPFYLYQCVGNSNPRSQISNNCINAGREGATSYGYYGVYSYYSGLYNFHNNSVNRRGGNNGYYTGMFRYGGLVSVMNNSFADYNNGYAFYADGFTVSESDYNNMYTNGSNLAYFGTSFYQTLEDFSNATGFDGNSINTDPAWEDTLACITCNDTLDNAGSYMSVAMYDIDSNDRSMTTPDIGAVEWVSPANFTLGGDSTYCADEVTIEAGPAQSVTWSVNGNSSTAPNLTLSGGTEAVTYNVLVSIQTEFCGSASDNALITLVPNAALDSNTHICADESATLNPGGLASGSYVWSTGASTQSINVNEPGSYTVTKDVQGCVSTATTIVTQSEAVQILGTEVCSDDLPLILDATIANGTSYAWSGGTSPTAATNQFNDGGAYTVTATDAFGCSSVDSFEVVVLEEPEAVITTPSYSGFIYIFDASSSPYLTSSSTVNWNFGAGASPATSTNVMETVVYPWSSPSNPASYSVSLEINNGCGVDIATQIVSPTLTGVEDLEAGQFAIFPNPANDVVTVATKDVDAGSIVILDMSGRVVAEAPMSAGTNNHEINVSDLAAGSYIVRVATDASTQMKQLIVQ